MLSTSIRLFAAAGGGIDNDKYGITDWTTNNTVTTSAGTTDVALSEGKIIDSSNNMLFNVNLASPGAFGIMNVNLDTGTINWQNYIMHDGHPASYIYPNPGFHIDSSGNIYTTGWYNNSFWSSHHGGNNSAYSTVVAKWSSTGSLLKTADHRMTQISGWNQPPYRAPGRPIRQGNTTTGPNILIRSIDSNGYYGLGLIRFDTNLSVDRWVAMGGSNHWMNNFGFAENNVNSYIYPHASPSLTTSHWQTYYVAKTDPVNYSTWSFNWEQAIDPTAGSGYNGGSADAAVVLPNNDLLVIGHVISEDNANPNYSQSPYPYDYPALMIKHADSDGAPQWMKKLYTGFDLVGCGVQVAPDGDYVAVYKEYNGSNNRTIIIKVDTNGTLVWQKQINNITPRTHGQCQISFDSDDDIVITLESSSVLRLPLDGSLNAGTLTATNVSNVVLSTPTYTWSNILWHSSLWWAPGQITYTPGGGFNPLNLNSNSQTTTSSTYAQSNRSETLFA